MKKKRKSLWFIGKCSIQHTRSLQLLSPEDMKLLHSPFLIGTLLDVVFLLRLLFPSSSTQAYSHHSTLTFCRLSAAVQVRCDWSIMKNLLGRCINSVRCKSTCWIWELGGLCIKPMRIWESRKQQIKNRMASYTLHILKPVIWALNNVCDPCNITSLISYTNCERTFSVWCQMPKCCFLEMWKAFKHVSPKNWVFCVVISYWIILSVQTSERFANEKEEMKKKFLESQRAEKQARVDTEQAKKQVMLLLASLFCFKEEIWAKIIIISWKREKSSLQNGTKFMKIG